MRTKKAKYKILNCVPYQSCPKCNGKGKVNSTITTVCGSITTVIHEICDVCNGDKIIPMCIIKNNIKYKPIKYKNY